MYNVKKHTVLSNTPQLLWGLITQTFYLAVKFEIWAEDDFSLDLNYIQLS